MLWGGKGISRAGPAGDFSERSSDTTSCKSRSLDRVAQRRKTPRAFTRPKRRILELYANVIEMGRGIYGVEAASRHYFGVSARGLTREQSAMLAAVLPNPKEWDPRRPGMADLAGADAITPEHVSEAIQHRTFVRALWV